jgi:hypothetical protein
MAERSGVESISFTSPWEDTDTVLPFQVMPVVVLSLFFLIVPVLLWVIQFGSLDVSANPKDWATFASYASGAVGTLIAALNLYVLIYVATVARTLEQREEKSARQDEAVASLHREWYSEPTYRSRDIAFKFLLENPNFDLDTEGKKPDRPDELLHVWIVLGFFQRLHAFIDNDIIEERIAVDLFGHIFIWWDKFVFRDQVSPKWSDGYRVTELRKIVQSHEDPEIIKMWEEEADSYWDESTSASEGVSKKFCKFVGDYIDGLVNWK